MVVLTSRNSYKAWIQYIIIIIIIVGLDSLVGIATRSGFDGPENEFP
jgi:hypothetical protein